VPDSARYRITAVCLGNICRSPIAESVIRQRVEAAGLGDVVVVDSAGTGDWHLGHGADPRSLSTLAANAYRLDGHTARQITPDWFTDLDLVLAMDSTNYRNLTAMAAQGGVDADLHMFRSFDPALTHVVAPDPELDVPDPYYGGVDGFDQVLAMIEQAADGLMEQLPTRLPR
jgi:protein-tyrosine phosphatase